MNFFSKFIERNRIRKLNKLKRYTQNNRKTLLYVLHPWGGGTEKHVMDLINSLQNNYNVFLLRPHKKRLVLTYYSKNVTITLSFMCRRETHLYPERGSRACYNTYFNILKYLSVDLIHIHHFIGHTFDFVKAIKEQKISLFISLHDYTVVCPNIFLVNEKREHCNNFLSIQNCIKCFSASNFNRIQLDSRYRYYYSELIDYAYKVIAPSKTVFDVIDLIYKIPEYKKEIIEHGHSSKLLGEHIRSPVNLVHSPFTIAYIGELERTHKGLETFYSLAKSNRLQGITKWIVIGQTEFHQKKGYYPDVNIHVYGRFKDYEELMQILSNEVDLVVHFSLCEVFSYCLSEAWAAGIPVLVSSYGALGERVLKNKGGWTIDVSEINLIEELLFTIIKERDEYFKIKKQIANIHLATMDEMIRKYENLYLYNFNSNPNIGKNQ